MRLAILGAVAGFAILLDGCAIKPQGLTDCHILRRELAVNDPASTGGGVRKAAAPGTLANAMTTAVSTRVSTHNVEGDDAMLFMSGGGQHGAFGAGLLKGWQLKAGKLPPFAVVTGVSTGSILSTYAFVGDGDAAVSGYTITSESQLLHPYVKPKGEGLGASAGLTLLRKGAIANLDPLRTRLSTALTDDMLNAVAKGEDDGRKLFVGVVDVDSGEAVALDLTDLGKRWRDAGTDQAKRDKIKTCYVEAILASSSAPVAAPPVFIDGRMYVDGGARFGVFSDEVGKAIVDRQAAGGLGEPATTYVIINGSQTIKALCPWASCLAGGPPPATTSDQPHVKWNFLNLALRSEDILVNQVYRFSADKIKSQADNQGRLFQFLKIDDDITAFKMALPDTGDSAAHDCGYWSNWDHDRSNPVQFYPHYMKCLIGYGEARAAKQEW